ncbi:MAG: aminotransferase class I/II-fold pyridoxal phosphate-dependent enzyme [Bacteroidota bacterium]
MNLPPFRLERYFAKYEFSTEFLLCASDCEAMSIGDLLALEPGADDLLRRTWLGYSESQGSPSLRAVIAAIYDRIQPEQILVHSGAEEAIFLFMHAVLHPGDHIIVHSPCYQSLADVAASIGCEVSLWTAREENGWALDLSDLPRLLRGSTRAIVVNTPHNPTGYLMPRADFDGLHRFALENGLLVFSDEVYRESEYDASLRLPAGCDQGEHAISLGVMSKTYGLAGLRIGWIATRNRGVYERMAALKDYTTICNSAPSEFLAALALRHRDELVRRNLDIIRRNLALIDGLFARHAELFRWVRPQAGSMGFPRLLRADVEQFCDRLVREAGVLLLPGSVYADSGNHFRLGLGRRNLPHAVQRLEQFLQKSESIVLPETTSSHD